MIVTLLSLAAYLLVSGFCGAWFWRAIRSAGGPVNTALVVTSATFGVLWPVLMPGVSIYRWVLSRGMMSARTAERGGPHLRYPDELHPGASGSGAPFTLGGVDGPPTGPVDGLHRPVLQ